MSDNSSGSKPKRLRPRMQFSLQTMLILTLVAALVCARLLTPRLQEKTLGGGALRIRARWTQPDSQPNATALPGVPEASVRGGRWILYDRNGRKLVDGRYQDGFPAGNWRYLDADGHQVLEGAVRRGVVDGDWTARHLNRSVSRQIRYRQVEYDDIRFPYYGALKGLGAERSGVAREMWENDQRRVVGKFAGDRRDGKWVWFDRQGRKVAAGTYRRGRKHGTWHRWDTAHGRPTIEHLVDGKPVDDVDALLTQLSADLQSDDVQKQARAVCLLETLDGAAVPALREMLRQGSTTQRLLAIRTLKNIGPDASAAAADLQAAVANSHPRIEFSALLALAEVDPSKAKKAIDQLLMFAVDDGFQHRDQAANRLLRAGPVGTRQLAAAVNDRRQDIRLAAMDAIVRMRNERMWGPLLHGDPNVDVGVLAEVMEKAKKHSDPQVRQRATSATNRSTLAGGSFF